MLYAAADTDVTICLAHVLKDMMMQDRLLINYYAKLAPQVQSIVLYEPDKRVSRSALRSCLKPRRKPPRFFVRRKMPYAFLALVPLRRKKLSTKTSVSSSLGLPSFGVSFSTNGLASAFLFL
ncbi:MAG: hypothetical protein IKO41_13045 [Lachnospiraceae bacterium]|nr:hypothetical protein [Lachnospiraceae bacterium]